MCGPKIFISHAYKDRMLIDAFVNLLTKAGIDEHQIISSSTLGTQIHTGKSLYTELRKELTNEKVFVIFMLSDNFYSSKICLNEMGAAWIMDTDCEIILLPGFSFDKVEGVICEKSLIGISLDTYDKNAADRFAHLRNDLTKHGFSISSDKWNLAILDFYVVVDSFKKQQIPQAPLSMKNYEGVCIGDDNRYGCQIIGAESTPSRITAIIDFSRTTSSLCSIVFYTDVDDWSPYLKDGKMLCFDIYSGYANIQGEVEVHLANGRNISTPIMVTTNWLSHRIPLSQFTMSEKAWSAVSQVCFLFRKDTVGNNAKIVIDNLRLEGYM